MKISKISISSFKCFAKADLEFGDITILSGLNSSGKSSIVQALRMFGESSLGKSPLIKGHGSYDELRSRFSPLNAPIEIKCTYENQISADLKISKSQIKTPKIAPIIYHLSAARLGPQSSLPLSSKSSIWPEIGSNGEFVVDFMKFFDGTIVSELLRRSEEEGRTFEIQLNNWVEEIAPGALITTNKDEKRDTSYYEINSFRPANAGFGVSYSLPILAAIFGLTAHEPKNGWLTTDGQKWAAQRDKKGVVLLIENPEAHLHPKAQTNLGTLLGQASQCGIQIIIETQSDYILDGIRIAVKNKKVPSTSTKVFYLIPNGDAPPLIESPKIFDDGRLEFWPKGFFDQTLKNRMELAR